MIQLSLPMPNEFDSAAPPRKITGAAETLGIDGALVDK